MIESPASIVQDVFCQLAKVTVIATPAAAQQQLTAPAPPPSSQPAVSPAPAGEAAARVEKVRADAVARRNARRVRVTLLDGSVATGRVGGVGIAAAVVGVIAAAN